MRLILIMGFLSFLTSFKNKSTEAEHASGERPFVIDLSTFHVGNTALGGPPSAADFFARPLQKSDVYEAPAKGIELGTKNGLLDYAFLTIDKFRGQFRADGQPVAVGPDSTEATIKMSFGEPYWTDRSDGDLIMFYEYAEGTVELQFEFPESRSLGFVTLSRNGVLSMEEQRRLYDIDKPWPPNNQ